MALGRTNINLTEIFAGYEQIVNYTMLYDAGDLCEEVTGGWTQANEVIGDNSGTVTFNANSVKCYVTGSGYKDDARIRTNSLVTLNGTYDKMCGKYINMEITGDNSTSTGTTLYMSVGTTATAYTDTISNCQRVYSLTDKTRYIQSLDLSMVSGDYYLSLGIGRGRDATGTGTAYVTHAWLTKADDVAMLASKAGITATSIDDILATSATLLANKDAVNFMVAQCTGDFMASAIASTTFLTALNNSPYKSVVQSNEHWSKFLAMVA